MSAPPPNPFSRRAVAWIVGLCAASFLVGLAFALVGDDRDPAAPPPTADANAFSRSALGHHAFVSLLRRLEVPVVVSRHASAARASDATLLVLEPDARAGVRALAGAASDSARVMVVLPKWRGVPDPDHGHQWIVHAEPLPVDRPDQVLSQLELGTRVVRPLTPTIACEAPRFAAAIDLPRPQLLGDTGELEPLIACPGGLLAGLRRLGDGTRLLVLSDPDLLSTHGLGRADNAAAAVGLVDALRDGGAVVVDETLHGFARRPSFWRRLFEFPLVVATLHGVVLLALALWAGLRRFGPVLAPPPAIAPGKAFLIANTADLLEVAGHSRASLARYWAAARADVAHALHAPPGLDAPGLRAFIAALGGGRHLAAHDAAEEAVRVATAPSGRRHLVRAARLVHAFKEEVLHGTRERT